MRRHADARPNCDADSDSDGDRHTDSYSHGYPGAGCNTGAIGDGKEYADCDRHANRHVHSDADRYHNRDSDTHVDARADVDTGVNMDTSANVDARADVDTGGGGGANAHPDTDVTSHGDVGSATNFRNANGYASRRSAAQHRNADFDRTGHHRPDAYADLDTNAGRRYWACAKDTGRRSTRYRRV